MVKVQLIFQWWQRQTYSLLFSIEPDVIIDFSHPSVLDGLLDYCLTIRVAILIATPGYSQEDIEKIHNAAKEIPLFFTANMSMGVNLIAELAKKAVSVLGDQFDIEIVEKHHNQKIDAPSGTALMLADEINKELDQPYLIHTTDKVFVKKELKKKLVFMQFVGVQSLEITILSLLVEMK